MALGTGFVVFPSTLWLWLPGGGCSGQGFEPPAFLLELPFPSLGLVLKGFLRTFANLFPTSRCEFLLHLLSGDSVFSLYPTTGLY